MKKGRWSRKDGSILLASTLIFILSITIALVYESNVGKDISDQKYEETKRKMMKLQRAVENFRQNNLEDSLPSLSGLFEKPGLISDCSYSYNNIAQGYNALTGWCGPYLDVTFENNSEDVYKDAWGVNFVFTSISTGSTAYRDPQGKNFGKWRKNSKRQIELQDITYTLRSCGKNRECNDGDDLVFTF